MSEVPDSPQRARAFVIRLAANGAGEWHGQAMEPGSADEWRVTVSSLAELWNRLEQRLTPAPTNPMAGSPGGDPASLGDQPMSTN
jgi:hypothetical protein